MMSSEFPNCSLLLLPMSPKGCVRPYIINVNKPAGITSFDVVRHFKRHLPKPYGKIGHLGTLDPFAEGVLLVAVGGAQRINHWLHGQYSKTYRARGVLGVQTMTGDLTVEPHLTDHSQGFKKLKDHSLDFFQDLWGEFVGEYLQTPPQFSASKYKGKPLHQWAREGVAVLKEPVGRKIFSLSVEKIIFPYVDFLVTVSSGTYIRVLFEDMAKRAGTFGALSSLCRMAIGPLSLEHSLPREKWPCKDESTGESSWRWTCQHGLPEQFPLPQVELRGQIALRYHNGHQILVQEAPASQESEGDFCWVITSQGELMGLAEKRERKGEFYWVPKVNFTLEGFF